MLGITLGVIALITVLSVMNGFHTEIHERILSMASHGDIKAYSGKLSDYPSVIKLAKKNSKVLEAAPYIQFQAMLNRKRNVSGSVVRGILPAEEKKVIDIEKHMIEGSLDNLQEKDFGVILGKELAQSLNVSMSDRLTIIAPKLSSTIVGNIPRLKRFKVVGIFEIGMNEYDSGVALIHISDASKLLGTKSSVTGVRIKTSDVLQARQISMELSNQFNKKYRILNWTDYHKNFFSALEMEKRMIGLLLSLIVVIAAFNIISTLYMTVTDKRSDIAILKTLGASSGLIMRIFIIQGAALGFIGTFIGTILGVLLAVNIEAAVAQIEKIFGINFIDPSIYYISQLPSDVQLADVIFISGGAFVLSLIMTIYPAYRAYKTLPAEALRYE
tara:strand:+ start:684 stop:1841 length:1158 start_codon:yes stop_codon:yes gene_type:complete